MSTGMGPLLKNAWSRRRRRILVVEPDYACFFVVSCIVRLSDPDVELEWAGSSAEARRLIEEDEADGLGYDLVIANPSLRPETSTLLHDSHVLVTTVTTAKKPLAPSADLDQVLAAIRSALASTPTR